jgi:hypothetical protein
MRENELANLLIRMSEDHGVDLDRAVDELASMALPSFVDARAFRAAIVEALEAQIRVQMEQRLQHIRRRFDVEPRERSIATDASAATPTPQTAIEARPTFAPPRADQPDAHGALIRSKVAPQMPPPIPATPGGSASAARPETDNGGHVPAEPDAAAAEDDELPEDATMVWTTRHG